MTKDDRQAAKSANFGLLCGVGASRLRSYARAAYGVELSEEQAHDYRERFFETYAGLRRWHQPEPDHPVATRTLARRRRLDVDRFTEKLNTPIQGTGADGLKLALALLFGRGGDLPKARPMLAVHHEIVVECEESDVGNARGWLESAMRQGMGSRLRRVPVEVEVEGAAARDWSMSEPLAGVIAC